MSKVNYELFQYIEKKGSVTVDDVAAKFGLSRRSAATMLSRFTNYDKDGIKKHYLIRVTHHKVRKRLGRYGPKNALRSWYKIGPDWWGELKGAKAYL